MIRDNRHYRSAQALFLKSLHACILEEQDRRLFARVRLAGVDSSLDGMGYLECDRQAWSLERRGILMLLCEK